jgi:hypothetical protein
MRERHNNEIPKRCHPDTLEKSQTSHEAERREQILALG